MRKFLIVFTIMVMLSIHGSAENVVRKEITISLPGVKRNGMYTGSLNEEGQPDGYGVFETVNTENIRWHYIGEWEKGKMTGEGWQSWEGGRTIIGVFNDANPVTATTYPDDESWVWVDTSDSFTVDNELVIRTKIYQKSILHFDGYVVKKTGKFYSGTRYNSDGTEEVTGYFNGYRPIEQEESK